MEWNRRNKFFDPDDIISFGDADEIASRHTIHALKYCDLENDTNPIDAGILFLNKCIFKSLETGQPVKGHPYSLGDPTFFTFSHCYQLEAEGKYASRNRGKSGHYILGGTHLTWFPYIPQLFLKVFACTECSSGFEYMAPFFDTTKPLRDVILGVMRDCSDRGSQEHDTRGKFTDGTEYYPWALKCNPLRYKSFALYQPDDRLYLSEDEVPFSC